MKFGSIFYEKLTEAEGWENHFEALELLGIRHLELTVSDRLLPLPLYKKMSQKMLAAQMGLSFHAPDFVEPSYGLKAFDSGLAQKALWTETFKQYSLLADGLGQTSLCVHGADYGETAFSRQEAEDRTLFFFDWALEYINRYHPELQLLIENTCPLDGMAFGQTLSELEGFFYRFDGAPHLGWCLDLPHLIRSQRLQPEDDLQLAVLQQWIGALKGLIRTVHVHGYSSDYRQSHLAFTEASQLQFKLLSPLRDSAESVHLPIIGEILCFNKPEAAPRLCDELVKIVGLI